MVLTAVPYLLLGRVQSRSGMDEDEEFDARMFESNETRMTGKRKQVRRACGAHAACMRRAVLCGTRTPAPRCPSHDAPRVGCGRIASHDHRRRTCSVPLLPRSG